MPRITAIRECASFFRPLACGLALLAAPAAWGAGFGQLSAHSALGEPLRATVTLLGTEDVAGVHCFQLTSATSRELIEASPRLELRSRGERLELRLESARPVKEPTLEIGLRMRGCGIELERDYVVLLSPRSLSPAPAAPVAAAPPSIAAQSPAAAPAPRPPRSAASRPARAQARAPQSPSIHAQAQASAPVVPAQPTPPEPAAVPITPALPPVVVPAAEPLAGPALTPPEVPVTAPAAARAPDTGPPPESIPWPPLWLLAGGLLSILTILFFLLRGRQHRRAEARRQLMGKPGWNTELALDAGAAPLPPGGPARVATPDTGAPRANDIEVRLEEVDAQEMARSFGISSAGQDGAGQDGGDDDYQQAMELTEVMLAYGRVREAAQTLHTHLEKHPRRSLESWLLLMKLYRQDEDRASFDATGEALRKHFNAAPPDWNDLDEVNTRGLLDMPHILAHLSRVWTQPEASAYLDHLLRDNRGGQRQGFPLSIIREILLLREIHKQREAR